MDSCRIAKNLVALRGEKSRESVANELGLSLSALAMYENGARIPRDETRRKSLVTTVKPSMKFFSLEMSLIVTFLER